jgi:hypothetical protein
VVSRDVLAYLDGQVVSSPATARSVETRIGYATVWCDVCHEGIAIGRSKVPDDVAMMPFGQDPAVRATVIPPDVVLLPPDPWPTPPARWMPPAGWQPDPNWPPAPEGWQWWVPAWD